MAADLTPIEVRHRPVPRTLDDNAIETVSEVLARGEPILHAAVAEATEVVAYCVQRLADSLDEPRTLRTPEHARRTLESLQSVLTGAADAVEAIARAMTEAKARGEVEGPWTTDHATGLATATATIRGAIPALDQAAAAFDQLTYTGPPFHTEADQIRGLVDELRKHGATVTFDPTATSTYQDSGGSGGWMLQFQVPEDRRHFQLFIGDSSLDDARPFELAYDDVHPALVVDYVLAHLADFVTNDVVGFADEELPGYINPAVLRRL